MGTSKAVNTLKAYVWGWSVFREWCAGAGRLALPADPETVQLFVAWAVDVRSYRLESVRLFLSAISYEHRRAELASPVDISVRELVAGAARKLQERPGGKAALTLEQLRLISRSFGDRPIDVRDRALLLVGFASGWRRGELSGLDLADVGLVAAGVRLHVWRSKTDQEGKGRVIGIPYGSRRETCPVLALRAWLRIRGGAPGPLWLACSPRGVPGDARLGGQGICGVLKRALTAIGVDPAPYGAHSLRAGMITAATEAGSPEVPIMQRTGQKSITTVLRYVRPAGVFRADPLARVL